MPASPLRLQRKSYLKREDGNCQIRVSHRKGRGKRSPSYIFRCGCCNEQIEVYYDEGGLEINGVIGSINNWRELLLPLLGIKNK